MDWTQIHLALNHMPVIGIPLFVLVLGLGWWRKSDDVTRLALWSLALLAGAAIAIKFTGEFAAEQAPERLASAKEFVSRHEDAGDQATTGVFLLGLAAALTLFIGRRGRTIPRWALVFVAVFGVTASLLFARSAHTGGQITHPELRKTRG
jgi:hypothetical protein